MGKTDICVFRLSSEESPRPETVFSEINQTSQVQIKTFFKPFCHFVQYKLSLAAKCCWKIHEYTVIN